MVKLDKKILPVIGFILLSIGILFYGVYSSGGASQKPRGSSGFYFAVNPSHNHEVWSVNYWLDINPEKGDIWIWFSFASNLSGECKFAFFAPYIISSLELVSLQPDTTNVTLDFMNATEGSLVYVTFSLNGSVQSPVTKVKLHVEDPVVIKNFGSYTMDIPFGSPPSEDVLTLRNNYPIGLSHPQNYTLLVTVLIPSNAILVRESEEINDRRFEGDYQILEFNIENPKTFLLQYTDPDEANSLQFFLFISGILIGSAISLIVSETGLKQLGRICRIVKKNLRKYT